MASYDEDDIEIVQMTEDHKHPFHQDYDDSDQLLGSLSTTPIAKKEFDGGDIGMYNMNRSASDYDDSLEGHESHKLWTYIERVRKLLRTAFFVLPAVGVIFALTGFVLIIHYTIRGDDSNQGSLIGITTTCFSLSLLSFFVAVGIWRRKSFLDLVKARKQGQVPK